LHNPRLIVDSIEELNALLEAADEADDGRRIGNRANSVGDDWAFEKTLLRPLPVGEVATFFRTLAAIGELFINADNTPRNSGTPRSRRFRVFEDLGPQDVAARFGLSCLSPERNVLAQKTA
jgi:hypothetical protein